MSLKSLLQRLLGIPARDVPAVDVTRLQGRSDWPDDLSQGPLVAPWDRPRGLLGPIPKPTGSAPWPVTDDPYVAPEPCSVVQDPALEKLAERGLSGRPLDSVRSVTDLLHLIERQEAAELHLTKLGMTWTRERGWHLPDPYLA